MRACTGPDNRPAPSPFATRWRSPFRHARHPGRVPDSDRPPFPGGRFLSRRFRARQVESSGFFRPALPAPCRLGPRPERDPPTRTRCRIPLLEPPSDCVGVPSLSRESLSLSGVAQAEKRCLLTTLFLRFFWRFSGLFRLLFPPASMRVIDHRRRLRHPCRATLFRTGRDAAHGHSIACAAARVSRASAQARVGFCRASSDASRGLRASRAGDKSGSYRAATAGPAPAGYAPATG